MLRIWKYLVIQNPILTLSIFSIIIIISALNASKLKINTNTEDMIEPNLAWRQDYINYKQNFPDQYNNILIILKSKNLSELITARQKLAEELIKINNIKNIIDPINTDFFYKFNPPKIQYDQNYYQFLLIKPTLDFSKLLPLEELITQIKHKTNQYPNIQFEFSGEATLNYEELKSVQQGNIFAAILSFIAVSFILWISFRQFSLVIISLFTLIIGLVITAGFAYLLVGTLNLISIAFAVLYIGLSIDFAIHFCLRFQELLKVNSKQLALKNTFLSHSKSLFFCTLTTCAGFLAFTQTNFLGVSQLGLIAAIGMVVSLVLSLFFLPCLINIFNINVSPKTTKFKLFTKYKYRKSILLFFILIISISAFNLNKLTFNADPMDLRSTSQSSVIAFNNLMNTEYKPQVIVNLVELNNLEKIKKQLLKLDTVCSVTSYLDFLTISEKFNIQIPQDIKNQWLTSNNLAKIVITPKYDLQDNNNLQNFVAEVLSVSPNATGLPVIHQMAGIEVVKAFITAFSYALAAIAFLCLIATKSLLKTILILIPLLASSLILAGLTVLLKLDFNFANIITLPLLLGIGVDNGIHIVHRFFTDHRSNIMQSSTTKAVLAATFTTIFSFINLAFSEHNGTMSMGILLTLGMIVTMLCTLVLLPVLLSYFNRKKNYGDPLSPAI